ncbi:unnamed protein product, partial [Iphiclides podalirius]
MTAQISVDSLLAGNEFSLCKRASYTERAESLMGFVCDHALSTTRYVLALLTLYPEDLFGGLGGAKGVATAYSCGDITPGC